MIIHEDGKWVLKTKDGSKVLGTHATKEEAEAQERAVEAHKHSDSKGAPGSGAWNVGDQVINTAPAHSGNIGWVCVTAGSPGTWYTFGAIS